jgi:hypothetical protein
MTPRILAAVSLLLAASPAWAGNEDEGMCADKAPEIKYEKAKEFAKSNEDIASQLKDMQVEIDGRGQAGGFDLKTALVRRAEVRKVFWPKICAEQFLTDAPAVVAASRSEGVDGIRGNIAKAKLAERYLALTGQARTGIDDALKGRLRDAFARPIAMIGAKLHNEGDALTLTVNAGSLGNRVNQRCKEQPLEMQSSEEMRPLCEKVLELVNSLVNERAEAVKKGEQPANNGIARRASALFGSMIENLGAKK